MNKPQSLRHALNKAVPYVRNNPDKLHLFVDNGSLVATGASSMSWEYRYTLNAVIEDFSGDQNLLMAPVLLWLRDNQPDAINNPALREKLFTFEVDILRNDVCDISLNLQLTERVLVSTDGSVSSVEAIAEPDAPEEMWTLAECLAGESGTSRQKPHDAPAGAGTAPDTAAEHQDATQS